jgi:hypothetical protein
MATLALTLSVLLSALGLHGIISPEHLAAFARLFLTPRGLWVAAAIRVALGVVFVLAAPESRLPWTLRAVGTVSILGGVITPVLGIDRHRQILDWWMGRGAGFRRSWSMVALVLGVILTYATI